MSSMGHGGRRTPPQASYTSSEVVTVSREVLVHMSSCTPFEGNTGKLTVNQDRGCKIDVKTALRGQEPEREPWRTLISALSK